MPKVELSLAFWKKNKAKTLGSEPLSDALGDYEDAQARLEKRGGADELVAVHRCLTRQVRPAIVATRSRCKDKLHAETSETLGEMEKLCESRVLELRDLAERSLRQRDKLNKAMASALVEWKDFLLGVRETSPVHAASSFDGYMALLDPLQKAAEDLVALRTEGTEAEGLLKLTKMAGATAKKLDAQIGNGSPLAELAPHLKTLDKIHSTFQSALGNLVPLKL